MTNWSYHLLEEILNRRTSIKSSPNESVVQLHAYTLSYLQYKVHLMFGKSSSFSLPVSYLPLTLRSSEASEETENPDRMKPGWRRRLLPSAPRSHVCSFCSLSLFKSCFFCLLYNSYVSVHLWSSPQSSSRIKINSSLKIAARVYMCLLQSRLNSTSP